MENRKMKEDILKMSDEVIMSKIYFIRSQKVMLDRDLAELYGVETKALKQAVKRNIERFPEDFMFEMSKEELDDWRSQFVTSNSDRKGLRTFLNDFRTRINNDASTALAYIFYIRTIFD